MKTLNKTQTIWKGLLMIVLLSSLTAINSFGQKFAYVDTDYILSELPTYKSAQKKINELATTWQKEVDALYDEVDKMYKNYNVEKVLLNSEQQKQREAEIVAKEREAKNLQQEKFGYEGEMFKKREELIKPIQDRVYDAIQKIAKKDDLDFIFDKSGDMVMLFSNARYDKSGEVLAELGITPLNDKPKDDAPPSGDLPPND
jgi:outer membrane protein